MTGTDVEGLLNRARSTLDRLSPVAAYVAWLDGAELVDIRPAAQRAYEGEVPGRCWSSATCSSGGSTPPARHGFPRPPATTCG